MDGWLFIVVQHYFTQVPDLICVRVPDLVWVPFPAKAVTESDSATMAAVATITSFFMVILLFVVV